jgi:hypothetical protein
MGLRLGPLPNRKDSKTKLPYDVEGKFKILKQKFPSVEDDNLLAISNCPAFMYITKMPVFVESTTTGNMMVGQNISTKVDLIQRIISNFNSGDEIRTYCIYDIQYPYIRGVYLDVDNIILRESKINKILN